MKRLNNYFCQLAAVAVAAAMLTLLPALVRAGGRPVIKVNGGGTATFDEVPDLASQFAVAATKHADGSVEGEFTCMIVGVVAITGNIDTIEYVGEDTVTLTGVGHGIDLVPQFFGPFFGCEFTITLSAGGPGVGGFVYTDCVVGPDAETVSKGHIMIKEF